MISKFAAAMFLSVTLASISQVLLKISAGKHYKALMREYLNPYVIGGYGLLLVSMFLTVYAYSGLDYKNGPMIESLGNVFVLVLGYFVFGEKISIRKLAGIVCIMAGIVIFNL
ncbi:4-amino-4-deoxy-L-arabinose-phosphoundecaprenol flippase subunit ArnE [Lachnospiraceae bacterium]|nr:4-amino-4-deoxy-L-arabinose-phosphoundecaprenol flippase subunit ArnE [Lachnospiraceae bacterium]